MAAKRYKSLTGTRYTFPVSVGGKPVWVSFGGPQNSYVASDEAVQDAIESSRWFTSGHIGVDGMAKSAVSPAQKKPTITAPKKMAAVQPPASDGVSTGTPGDAGIPIIKEEDAPAGPTTVPGDDILEVQDGGVAADGGTPEAPETENDDAPEDTAKMAVFPNVTDVNGAVAVLRTEPYNVAHQALRTPEKVRAHAAIHNVSFPNWTA